MCQSSEENAAQSPHHCCMEDMYGNLLSRLGGGWGGLKYGTRLWEEMHG